MFHNSSFFYYQLRRAGTCTEMNILRRKSLSDFFLSSSISRPRYVKKELLNNGWKSARNGAPKLLVNDRFYKQFCTLAITPSKLFINDRFYKQFRPLGFACSKPFINNRFYKQSRPCGMTNSELSRNDWFYKQFWHRIIHRIQCQNMILALSHQKTFSIITGSPPKVHEKNNSW